MHFTKHVAAVWGLAALLLVPVPARAGIELVGKGTISGTATDRSGLDGRYSNADGELIPANQFGSFGSSITYSGANNRYYVANDRGFGDGTSASVDRLHVLEITVDPQTQTLTPKLLETRFLTDESGRNFVGLASNYAQRFDPEGLRVGRDGTLYISDEYGPFVWQFSPEGRRLKTLPVPAKFAVTRLDPDETAEIRANRSGRLTNKGMEGLAITPDGRELYGIMQSPLIQDHGRDGVNIRILNIDLSTNATREYVYPLDSKKYGVSEILAVDDHRFLVLEREGKGGAEAKFKKLFLIDTRGASDVSATGTTPENGLPAAGLPAGVKPVTKRPFLDMLDSRFGLASAEFPEKIEGLTWGPNLPAGRRLLIVTSDNDLKPKQPTYIWAFAVDPADLGDR